MKLHIILLCTGWYTCIYGMKFLIILWCTGYTYKYSMDQLIIVLCTVYIFRLQYKGHLDIRFYLILLCTGCSLMFQYKYVLEYWVLMF